MTDKQVYAVTAGEYSDKRVVAVFSTKEGRDRFLEGYTAPYRHESNTEEYPLDPEPFDGTFTENGFVVAMFEHGDAGDVDTMRSQHCPVGFIGYEERWASTVLIWGVDTDDEERAIKVVNEKRALLVASGLWGNTEMTRKMQEYV